MNNTKWNEIRLGVCALKGPHPRYRARSIKSGLIGAWDGEWFHHFYGRHEEDEWVEIAVVSPAQRAAVLAVLRRVHVPGVATDSGFKIFGYVEPGTPVDYL
ncbi:hypothetical protein RD110_00445 [Rhodoferax koreense]|uniref:Uncharacterized protein n=1 Tax=Rhodoferax koreensis TaxID=1842727 RepID=A0A1P8K2Z9_9BURK|nr:DUF6678 family protein [Rhodoferax koreense]APW40376.1 hypothetical protein RD110_00445 [Rhodoferax koreense]